MHGFALNVNNTLEGFKKINPCGLESSVMSSVQNIMGCKIPLEDIQDAIIGEIKK